MHRPLRRRTTAIAFTLVLLAVAPSFAQLVCPEGMAQVDDFCIDRWEAHLVGQTPYEVPTSGVAATGPGTVPQGYISGVVASNACIAAGKRLCTSVEWLRACRGPGNTIYPYGNSYVAGRCNDTRPEHPIITLFGSFIESEINNPLLNQLPDSVDPTGANAQCVSAEGVYDLHGNLEEWIADAAGTFRGGDYVEAALNGPGCLNVTTAHNTLHHEFTTGFRCCAEPVPPAPEIPAIGPGGVAALCALLLLGSAVGVWWRRRESNPRPHGVQPTRLRV